MTVGCQRLRKWEWLQHKATKAELDPTFRLPNTSDVDRKCIQKRLLNSSIKTHTDDVKQLTKGCSEHGELIRSQLGSLDFYILYHAVKRSSVKYKGETREEIIILRCYRLITVTIINLSNYKLLVKKEDIPKNALNGILLIILLKTDIFYSFQLINRFMIDKHDTELSVELSK